MKNQDNMGATMDKIADAAPFIAFIVACLAFIIIILFKTDYYSEVFSQRWNYWAALGVGFFAALAAEASRAILLLLTFRDFRNRNMWGGFLGLILSFALVGYDIFSAGPVSSIWTGAHSGQVGTIITDVVVFLVALSAGLELRLALSTKHGAKRNTATPETEEYETDAETQRRAFYETAQRHKSETRNGNGIYNETDLQHEAQRPVIRPFVVPATQRQETGQNTVSNGVSRRQEDAALLAEELERAKGNLRAYRSKLRNRNGNPETLQRGVDKWELRVSQLEQRLQDAT